MPDAEPFTALGRGNGFPFCISRVNVDDYDYWTTLSGFKKTNTGNPTQAQIDESLQIASRLWWNSYQWAGNVSSSSDGESITSATFSLNNDGVDIEPMYRACVISGSSIRIDVDIRPQFVNLTVRNNLRPIALLRGGELMGYSIDLTSGKVRDPRFASIATVELSGYADDWNASPDPLLIEYHWDVDYLDITLGSLNFTVVSNCRASARPSSSATVTASSAFAEISNPGSIITVDLLANGGPYSFYTYPA